MQPHGIICERRQRCSRSRTYARMSAEALLVSVRAIHLQVYIVRMGRTNVDIDDELIDRVMRIHRVSTKREAVDLALRRLVAEPMTREEALAMQGTGWDGDIELICGADDVPYGLRAPEPAQRLLCAFTGGARRTRGSPRASGSPVLGRHG